MDGGSKLQTQNLQAPSWQQPYQQYGLNQAESQYQNTPQLVAPFAPQQEQAINNISALANGTGSSSPSPSQPQQNWGWGGEQPQLNSPQIPGSSPSGISGIQPNAPANGSGGPWINGAQDYITNTLNGNVQQNPELNALFNQGADAIQNRLSSQFAGSGRNVGASAGANTRDLGTFAANLFGNAFNTEAGLQEGALGAAPSIVGSQLGLQNALYGAGSNVQNLAQQYIQAPQNSLNQYLSRVNGNLGSTQTYNPAFNAGAGALGGALVGGNLGNSIGSMFGGSGGSYGSILGALAGGLLGG